MKEYIVKAIVQETIDLFDALNTPELIRCKDCKFVECEGREGNLICVMTGFSHKPYFFCADGERKEV